MRRFVVALVASFFAVALTAQTPVPVDHATVRSASVGQAATDQKVVFNPHSLIYHCASCSAARRCTKNCITTTLADAQARGGRACKLCGGTCGTHLTHRLALLASLDTITAETTTTMLSVFDDAEATSDCREAKRRVLEIRARAQELFDWLAVAGLEEPRN